jgi:hypothetical protein
MICENHIKIGKPHRLRTSIRAVLWQDRSSESIGKYQACYRVLPEQLQGRKRL